VGLHGAKGLPNLILYNEYTRYQLPFHICRETKEESSSRY